MTEEKLAKLGSAIGGLALAIAIAAALTFGPMIYDAFQPEDPPPWLVEQVEE